MTMESKSEWDGLVRDRIHRREEELWLMRALNKPKLRTYTKFKRNLRMEKYLQAEDGVGRRMLARIRGGTHVLRIEQGRYNNIRRDERICKVCGTGIEDELHFLITCPAYKEIRENCLRKIDI